MLRGLLFIWVSFSLSAQQFTKITSGPPVSDGGASRSVNWLDYNNDGYLDLFVSNSSGGKGTSDFLYRNLGQSGNYSFSKITRGPVIGDFGQSDGASFGDYDNDGDKDLFVVNWYNENNMFYENNGAPYFNFSAITSGAPVTDGGLSETCVWGDYNNDGYLDLYVTNSGNAGVAQANFLYKNNGNKTFTKITAGEIVTDVTFTRGAKWIDYDQDGDQDLFVVNESNQNNDLYKNLLIENGAEGFTKISGSSVVSDGGNSMSASWGDFNNDGNLDVLVVNGFPSAGNEFLYLQNNDHTFTKVTTGDLVSSGGASMGSALGDFDNDGDLDVYVTNSYAGTPSVDFLFKNMLIENGSLSFQKITNGSLVTDQGDGYGCAWGDYDRDGDLDLFVAKTANENQNNALYRNDNTTGYHSVQFRCVGTMSNRSAIGTIIRVKAVIGGQSVWQTRVIEGQSGYCGQTEYAHFGLHSSAIVDSVEFHWPRGHVDVYTGLSADSLYTVTENGSIQSVSFTVNTPPSQIRFLRDTTLLEDFGRSSLLNVKDYFGDADSTDLNFTVTALSAGVTVNLSGDSVILRSVQDFFGAVMIRITATDDIISLADTLTLMITDVSEPILRPGITTSVFQNPAAPTYADVVVISTLDLDTAPNVTMKVVNTNFSTTLQMTAVNSSKRIFKGAYRLSDEGAHTITTSVRTYQDFDSTNLRSFSAVLSKNISSQSITSPDGRSRVISPENAIEKGSWQFLSEEPSENTMIYEWNGRLNPGHSAIFEIKAPSFNNHPVNAWVIARWEDGQWNALPSRYEEGKHIIRTNIHEPGKYMVIQGHSDQENNFSVDQFILLPNYPNPFNPTTTIRFTMHQTSHVRLTIYNTLGQKVRTLTDGVKSAGLHHVLWDGRNDNNETVASGIYLYRLESLGNVSTRKMMLLK